MEYVWSSQNGIRTFWEKKQTDLYIELSVSFGRIAVNEVMAGEAGREAK